MVDFDWRIVPRDKPRLLGNGSGLLEGRPPPSPSAAVPAISQGQTRRRHCSPGPWGFLLDHPGAFGRGGSRRAPACWGPTKEAHDQHDPGREGRHQTKKPLFTRMHQHPAGSFLGMDRGVRRMSRFRAHADRSCPEGRGHYCESGTVSAKNGRHGGQPAKTAERRNKAGVLVGGSHGLKARAV